MKSNYKRLGDFIKLVNRRNSDGLDVELLGINIDKFFMPSVANVVGTDLTKYKLVEKNQFACNRMHVGRDYRIPIAMSRSEASFIVSPAYTAFEIKDTSYLLPEYLMMWFMRPEFDRECWFHTDADVRGGLPWDLFCDIELPIPSIEKQREIVAEYNTLVNRIKLNEQLNQKLEEAAQTLYKNWFVDTGDSAHFKSLDSLIEFNPKHTIKKNEIVSYVEMSDLQEDSLSIKNIAKREFTAGSKFKNNDTLLARITPCLENGKTAFVDGLNGAEVGYGSTEFIVMRPKNDVSPFWVYCLAREKEFRTHAISSMIGSSGRERVHSDYLKEFQVPAIDKKIMDKFHNSVKPIFESIRLKSLENQTLRDTKDLILAKMTQVEVPINKIRMRNGEN